MMAVVTKKEIQFDVKRLYHNESDPDPTESENEIVSIGMTEEDKFNDLSPLIRSKLQLNNPDLIIRVRNSRDSFIPLNGKMVLTDNDQSPFTLEVVQRFQTVNPKPNSLELSQYAESLRMKILLIQERLHQIENCMENMMEKRQDKVQQEISKLENTVNFIKKRIEDAETIEWKGMFVKNPLW